LQKSDIWSQALYRYPISWESFFDPSDSYFLFTEERGYHKWALAHSSSCWLLEAVATCLLPTTSIIFSLREEYYILPTWRVLYSPYVKSIIFSLREEYYIPPTWRVLYSPYGTTSLVWQIVGSSPGPSFSALSTCTTQLKQTSASVQDKSNTQLIKEYFTYGEYNTLHVGRI
jgi:hypothetical protein